MTLKKQNPWKLLSVGLLSIITIGLLAPVDAAPPSGSEQSQLEALFDLISEVLGIVEGIDTDLGDLAGNVTAIKTETDKIPMIESNLTAIKTETDKIPMIKSDVGDILTNVTAIKTETDKIQDVKDDVGTIKTNVDSLVSSGTSIFRVTHSFDDDEMGDYSGTIKIDRTTGDGVYQIEKLYLCDLKVGSNTGQDRLRIKYLVEGEILEDPDGVLEFLNDFNSGPVTDANPGCIDVLYSNKLNSQIGLAGDGSNDVVLSFDESDVDTTEENDPDGARIVAYISGLNSSSDVTITDTIG